MSDPTYAYRLPRADRPGFQQQDRELAEYLREEFTSFDEEGLVSHLLREVRPRASRWGRRIASSFARRARPASA
jgi:hypothetical protein